MSQDGGENNNLGSSYIYQESDGRCCKEVDAEICVRPAGMFLEVPDLESSLSCEHECDNLEWICLGYDFHSGSGMCTVLGPNITFTDVYNINLWSPKPFTWIGGTGTYISGGQYSTRLEAKCFVKTYSNATTADPDPCQGGVCGDPCYEDYIPPDGCDLCICPYSYSTTTAPTPALINSTYAATTNATDWGGLVTQPSLQPTLAPSFEPSTTSTTSQLATSPTDWTDVWGDSSFVTTQIISESEEDTETTFWSKQQMIIIFVVGGLVLCFIIGFWASNHSVDDEKTFAQLAQAKVKRASVYFGVGKPMESPFSSASVATSPSSAAPGIELAMHYEQHAHELNAENAALQEIVKAQQEQLANANKKAGRRSQHHARSIRKSMPKVKTWHAAPRKNMHHGGSGRDFVSPQKKREKKGRGERRRKTFHAHEQQNLQQHAYIPQQAQPMQIPGMQSVPQPKRQTVSRKTRKGNRRKKPKNMTQQVPAAQIIPNAQSPHNPQIIQQPQMIGRAQTMQNQRLPQMSRIGHQLQGVPQPAQPGLPNQMMFQSQQIPQQQPQIIHQPQTQYIQQPHPNQIPVHLYE